MRAVTVKKPGGADQLEVTKHSKPIPKEGELLIKVEASAINRTDILTRENQRKGYTRPTLGIEVAGVVEALGDKSNLAIGSRVMGLVNGGGYAEYVTMPADRAMLIPKHFTFEEAAAIPEVFLTAYQTLYWLGKLQEGETVLIHAGGSGVGTAAIQLAKQLSKARIITTAGSKEKLDFCRSLGADLCINYKEENFAEEVLKETNNQGVDLILDFVGASYWTKNMQSISIDGRWVLIGILGGTTVDKVNLMELMSKRIQLTGTLLTPRSDGYKASLTSDFINETIHLFEENKLKPIIDTVFTLEEATLAHKYMEENKNIGKIILKINENK